MAGAHTNGSFKGRREDLRLVTGRGKYAADWTLPAQLYGHFLRADRAHAEILSIDTDEAGKMPGVVAIFTAADAEKAGFKNVPNMMHVPGVGGVRLRLPFRSCLARDRVHYVGQQIALVVAETAAMAADAAERIDISFRDLTAVVSAEDALAPDAPALHADQPHNLAFEYEYGDAAGTAAAFERAAHVVEVSIDCQRLVGNPMEPKSCTAAYDEEKGILELYMPSQGASMVQQELAEIIGMPPEKIRVNSRDVGGGFGVRSEAYTEYVALSLAARSLGRPVKWVGTRSETFVSDHHGRGEHHRGELALDKDGRFLAIRVEWLIDVGAFCSNVGILVRTLATQGQVAGPYATPVAYGRHRLAFTNATPTTAYRGAARPNVVFVLERLIDEAARVTGIDRVELRRRNLLKKEAFPYKTPTGANYDSGDPLCLLETVASEADWKNFAKRQKAAKARGKLRGLGLAVFIEPSGGATQKDEVAIKFGASGAIDLFAPVGPSGQGNETVFPEIVAEIFGLPAEQITLRYNDPDGPMLIGMGSISSRTLINHGAALSVGAKEIVEKGRGLAAEMLEVSAQDCLFENGAYHVSGTDLSITLADVIRKYAVQSGPHPLDLNLVQAAASAWPTGAHTAEVEIDPETGTLSIIRYVAVDDCGRIINHTIVDGQLHGGIAQGLGQGIGEACIYDRHSGQILTGSFMDYMMPRASDLPAFELHDRPTMSPTNALGAKGVGETGTTGAISTIASAVGDALFPLGVRHVDMPFTPSRLWTAIREAKTF